MVYGEKTMIIGLLLLGLGMILLVLTVQKGKRIARFLKEKYPEQWKKSGKPAPGYFQSSQRRRWFEFLQQEEYLDFDDTSLAKMGEWQRRLERITLAYIITFIVGYGGLLLWFELF